MSVEMHEHPACYFIRSEDGAIPSSPSSSSGTHRGYSKYFEFGVFNGEILSSLANLMSNIYIPTIKRNGTTDENLKHELNSNMSKFEQQIRQVVQQVEGDVRLNIPHVVITDPEQSADDYDVVSQLEKALAEWTSVIAAAVENEHQKVL